MENTQAKLLISLAKRLKTEKKDKLKAKASLMSAGILDNKGRFTKHYTNLEKAIETSTAK